MNNKIKRNKNQLYHKIISNFSNQQIAVIGDIMLDKYLHGEVDRISPEAPIPVLKVTSEKFSPGGAANVAANISTLSGTPFLFGIVGDDPNSTIVHDLLAKFNIETSGVIKESSKKTICKTRVVSLNQQLIRIDHEDNEYIEKHFAENVLEKLAKIDNLSVIIISDYAKGTITEGLMRKIIQFSKIKNIPIIVDPKPKHMNWYKNAFLITPNQKETEEMSHTSLGSKESFYPTGKKLQIELNSNIIITAGADGMYVFENALTSNPSSRERGEVPLGKGEQKGVDHLPTSELTPQNLSVCHIPTVAKEVFDVSGAGDTVVAALALGIACGASIKTAAEIANLAAGIKVGKVGTQPVYLKELIRET